MLASGRRLPQTPVEVAANGHSRYGTPYNNGLPADPRPNSRQSPSTHRPDTASSYGGTEAPSISMPVPDVSGGSWGLPITDYYYNSGPPPPPPSNRAHTPRLGNGYDETGSRSPDSLDDMYASPVSSDLLQPGRSYTPASQHPSYATPSIRKCALDITSKKCSSAKFHRLGRYRPFALNRVRWVISLSWSFCPS